MSKHLKQEFLLDPDVIFLNHGSFGACPRPVSETYQRWQAKLERQPVEFLGRRLNGPRPRRARRSGAMSALTRPTWCTLVVLMAQLIAAISPAPATPRFSRQARRRSAPV
jgi:hypothetical protein